MEESENDWSCGPVFSINLSLKTIDRYLSVEIKFLIMIFDLISDLHVWFTWPEDKKQRLSDHIDECLVIAYAHRKETCFIY